MNTKGQKKKTRMLFDFNGDEFLAQPVSICLTCTTVNARSMLLGYRSSARRTFS